MRIIFAGSGIFGMPTLHRLVEAGHEIAAVVTQPDRPAGRGKKLTATPIGGWAEAQREAQGEGRGMSVLKTGDINKEQLPAADVMVVIAFGQKIGEHVVNHPRLGSVNLHASLLPKYRGAAPINWAILRGESQTGNSVIRLAQRMDAGAILAQSELAIDELETAGELHDRLAEDGGPLVERVLRELNEGKALEREQDERLATSAPKLNREATRIEWSKHAREIANQIRGMYPWPGCRVRVVDGKNIERGRATLVRVKRAGVSGEVPMPGIVLTDGTVGTGGGAGGGGAGALEVVELQPEGKRAMSLAEYRNGHPWSAGMRLDSIV